MTSQIKLLWGGVDLVDIALDVDRADHLEFDATEGTAVLIALSTELRATAAQAPDPNDLGGSWHESYYDATPTGSTPVGSLLWTLTGRGMTAEVLGLAEQYARQALKRWTDAGYALTWTAVQVPPSELRCTVVLKNATDTVSVPVIVQV